MTTKEKTKPVKTLPVPTDRLTTLLERKGELSNVIETESLRRAAATLDGEAFDPATLKAAQDELAAVEGAEREQVRRQNVISLAAAADERSGKAGRAMEVMSLWLAAIDEQELAARTLVDATGRGEAARLELQKLLSDLHGTVPIQLTWHEQETRRYRCLSALLHDYKAKSGLGNPYGFGDARLNPGLFKASDSWSAAERDLALDLETQLKEVLK